MDMQAGRGFNRPANINQQELTFHWLYERVQGLIDQSIYPKAGRLERWSFRVGMAAAAIGLLGGLMPEQWIPVGMVLPLVLICLFIEMGGFILGWALSARRQFRQYIQPRLWHAKEMDGEFSQWQSVIAEIRKFPRIEREQRLRYVSTLRTGMIDRMGLVYGGLQRLGPFPLLIAFYVQYRAWKQGNWAGVFDVGWAGALLIFAMVLLYLLAWVTIGLRVRLDTYVALLEASVQEAELASSPAMTVEQDSHPSCV